MLRELAPAVGTAVGIDEIAWRVVVEHLDRPSGGTPGAAGPAWDRVDVVAELRTAVTTPGELDAALAGLDVTPVLRQRTAALTPRGLGPGELGIAEGSVPLRGLAPAGDPGGLHPLRLRVVADGREVARLDTAVIRLDRTPSPAPLAVVWPLTQAPLLATGDVVGDAVEAARFAAAIAPGGRLRTVVDTLAAADPTFTAAIALAPAAHLLEDLAATAADPTTAAGSDAARVRATIGAIAAAARAGPVAMPYADIDLGRLLATPGATSARLAATAADEGGRRLLPLVGRTAAPVTLLHGSVSPRALDLVERVVVVPGAVLAADGSASDRAVRRADAASGRIVTLVVADTGLTDALDGTAVGAVAARQGGPTAAAQEVLVRTAALLLRPPGPEGETGEAGDVSDVGRAAVLLPSTDLDPDPDALAELVTRLATAPWLSPITPAALAARGSVVSRPPAVPVGPGGDGVTGGPTRLTAAVTAADTALRTAIATVDVVALDAPLVLAGRTPRELDDVLLRAVGAGVGASRGAATAGDAADRTDRAVAAAKRVGETAERALGPVVIAVGDLTLTAGTGPLPMTVDGAGPLPLRLTVEVVGPAALEWPLGTRWDVALPVGSDVALQVPVAARATGVFPVTVLVLDAGGGVLAEATVAVRATELAGPALIGIGVTVAVMTVIGLVRQRRRARSRRA